jgi:thiamine-phosphate pyrophosphorylase
MATQLLSAAIGFNERTEPQETSRVPSDASLYLDFEVAPGPPEQAAAVLAAVLDWAPLATILFRSPPEGALDPAVARPLIRGAQEKGIAALIIGPVKLATKLGADGIHLPWSRTVVQQFKEARNLAPRDTIIGADAGRTRHDAMELGEAGADYIAFGIPPDVEDLARAAARQLELVSWWSELFEVPCVAFNVPDAHTAQELAQAGADFVTLALRSTDPIPEALSRVRAFSEAIKIHETAK